VVEWPSGEATACKAVHTGSIPVSTSKKYPARLAQRESASLTRKRSLVQSQYRAPHFAEQFDAPAKFTLYSTAEPGMKAAEKSFDDHRAKARRFPLVPMLMSLCATVHESFDVATRSVIAGRYGHTRVSGAGIAVEPHRPLDSYIEDGSAYDDTVLVDLGVEPEIEGVVGPRCRASVAQRMIEVRLKHEKRCVVIGLDSQPAALARP
jgi:hypothetical protein